MLTAKEINALLRKIKRLAQRLVNGYSVVENAGWRRKLTPLRMHTPLYGHKFIGNLNLDAYIAEKKIATLCERTFPRNDYDEND